MCGGRSKFPHCRPSRLPSQSLRCGPSHCSLPKYTNIDISGEAHTKRSADSLYAISFTNLLTLQQEVSVAPGVGPQELEHCITGQKRSSGSLQVDRAWKILHVAGSYLGAHGVFCRPGLFDITFGILSLLIYRCHLNAYDARSTSSYKPHVAPRRCCSDVTG